MQNQLLKNMQNQREKPRRLKRASSHETRTIRNENLHSDPMNPYHFFFQMQIQANQIKVLDFNCELIDICNIQKIYEPAYS